MKSPHISQESPYFHLTNLGKLRSDLTHHETSAEANTQIIHKTKHIPENSRNTQKAHYYSPKYRATRTHN